MGLGVGFYAAKNLLIGTLENSLTVLLKLNTHLFHSTIPLLEIYALASRFFTTKPPGKPFHLGYCIQ